MSISKLIGKMARLEKFLSGTQNFYLATLKFSALIKNWDCCNTGLLTDQNSKSWNSEKINLKKALRSWDLMRRFNFFKIAKPSGLISSQSQFALLPGMSTWRYSNMHANMSVVNLTGFNQSLIKATETSKRIDSRPLTIFIRGRSRRNGTNICVL